MKTSKLLNRVQSSSFTALLIAMSILISGCSVLASLNQSSGSTADDDSQYGSQEQALGSEDDDSGDEGDMSDDLGLITLTCPSEPTEFVIDIAHNWDFSPNRDLEMMKVNGQTEPSAFCPITISGSTVIMEDCRVPYTTSGFVQTDEGPCDISASGTAIISVDEPYCKDGMVVITFIESADPDAASQGALNCPGYSGPFLTFFPTL